MSVESAEAFGMYDVAFVLQNVGGARFDRDVGDTVPVKQSILGLRSRGHRVTCFKLAGASVLRMDGKLDPKRARISEAGIAEQRLFLRFEGVVRRIQRELGLPYYALFDTFRFYQAALRFLPSYDICHEYHGLFSAGASLACSRLDIPYVLSIPADQILEQEVKGDPVRGLRGMLAKRGLRFALRSADRIILVSEAARRHLESAWSVDPDKIVVLPNGVDLDLFAAPRDPDAGRKRLGVDGSPVIMFVGSFQAWHGLDRLVLAFKRLESKLPMARLVFVGDGPARASLEASIRQAGVEGSAQITGYVPQREIPDLLAAADVAVLPYPELKEELWFSPLKLFEYMAAGKAIVASRAGQIEEVIKDGVTGVLVEPGDPQELERALSDLIANPDLRARLGNAARKQALARHSWRDYSKKLEDVYRDVVREHRENCMSHA